MLEDTLHTLAPQLLRFCVGLCADHALGEEVAQDAMTALVQRWRAHGAPDDPAAFAFAVARRRAARRRWRRSLWQPLTRWMGAEDPRPDPERTAQARQTLAETLLVLERLRPRDREALLMAISGLESEQAARALSLSPSAYKMRLHRARRRLREALERSDVVHTRT